MASATQPSDAARPKWLNGRSASQAQYQIDGSAIGLQLSARRTVGNTALCDPMVAPEARFERLVR
jgi:hypothetical protein